MLLRKPKEISWVEVAGLPENWMTGEPQSFDERSGDTNYGWL